MFIPTWLLAAACIFFAVHYVFGKQKTIVLIGAIVAGAGAIAVLGGIALGVYLLINKIDWNNPPEWVITVLGVAAIILIGGIGGAIYEKSPKAFWITADTGVIGFCGFSAVWIAYWDHDNIAVVPATITVFWILGRLLYRRSPLPPPNSPR